MGGCFPCFGSSNKENSNGGENVKELSKKDSTKDGSVCQSNHVNRVNSNLPPNKEPLDWNIRMRIVADAAKGLEYLHDKANPNVIYRDIKSSNILLDEGYHPKLSGFGLAKLGPVGDKTQVSTRVMGTYGYCAPEYAMTGQLTLKSDVYIFTYYVPTLITGRKAIDNTRAPGEQNLARPLFRDRKKFLKMVDPLLQASQTYDPNAPNNQSNRGGLSTLRLKDD
ncbi:hypothetical protein GQ457_09G023390 [Hibiscus cannabinus]